MAGDEVVRQFIEELPGVLKELAERVAAVSARVDAMAEVVGPVYEAVVEVADHTRHASQNVFPSVHLQEARSELILESVEGCRAKLQEWEDRMIAEQQEGPLEAESSPPDAYPASGPGLHTKFDGTAFDVQKEPEPSADFQLSESERWALATLAADAKVAKNVLALGGEAATVLFQALTNAHREALSRPRLEDLAQRW